MNLWESFEKVNNNLNDKLLTIPPYPSVSGSKVQELLSSLENPDPAWGGLDGEILRMVKNPWQRAYQIEYRFRPAKIFKDFIKILECATLNLMSGNNICSYLSLVPVVEATLRKWSLEIANEVKSTNKYGDFSIHIFTRNLVKYLNEINSKRDSNPRLKKWISHQIEFLDYMIREIFFLKFSDSEEGVKKEFNRNRTLHLLDNIGDLQTIIDNNTRIFLLLDIISELYLILDEVAYSANTFDAYPEDNIDFMLRWRIYLKNALDSINFTDTTIIDLAFLRETNELISDDLKHKLIKIQELQIKAIQSRKR